MDKIPDDMIEKNFEKYKIIRTIGRGGFSLVYLSRNDVQNFVIKQVKNSSYSTKEIQILLEIQDIPNVVKLKKICYRKIDILLITDYLPKTIDLFDYISQERKLTEELSKNILLQLLTIIKNLSLKKIYHNDIKDENILINYETKIITLIDFGAATKHDEELQNNTTIVYSPPEWLKDRLFLKKEFCVWSLGILMFNMICGNIPFHDSFQVKNLNQEKINEKISEQYISDECKNFILECLNINYDERITLENMFNHQFLRS